MDLFPQYVILGNNVKIGKFVILGEIPRVEKIQPLEIGADTIIRSHSVIYTNTTIGDNFQTGHGVLIRENCVIGKNVSVGSHSVLERDVILQDNVRIHSNVFIPEYTCIEQNAWIGPNVVMTNAYHPLCSKVKECLKGPTIRSHVIIGAHVTIAPYVTIGENVFIGAGSVVTKDIPDNMVAYGSPARIIKRIDQLKCKTGIKNKNPYKSIPK
ncbi:MAG: N-acetyltransferase [Candidatus Lokiarchaeota archaeon]|nr:N-acetyltransferase [Candidatus Lokiarchaeota archaeon]